VISTALLPFQTINAQNMTISMDNATGTENATSADQVSGTVLQNLAAPGLPVSMMW
jgi:hypothetical protein